MKKALCVAELRSQCRLIAESRRAALDGTSPRAIHDLRVAIRRFRTVLRIYRHAWRGMPAAPLRRRLATLDDALSPARDHEVWLAFLRCPEVTALLSKTGGLRLLHRAQSDHDRLHKDILRRLKGAPCARLLRDVEVFVRQGNCVVARHPTEAQFLAHRLRRRCRRLFARPMLPAHAAPVDFHRLRKRIRRARYGAEFAVPLLGHKARRLARRLKDAADALGDIHDFDMHMARLRRSAGPAAAALSALLRRKRRAAWQAYARSWTRLTHKPPLE